MPCSTSRVELGVMNRLLQFGRGLSTVVKRRGLGYVAYLCTGYAWPRAAYRFGWGPDAPRAGKAGFSVIEALSARTPTVGELRRVGLLADDGHRERIQAAAQPGAVERLMDRAHAARITGVRFAFYSLHRNGSGLIAFSRMPGVR